jgi:hypothetical protein
MCKQIFCIPEKPIAHFPFRKIPSGVHGSDGGKLRPSVMWRFVVW